MMKNFMSIILTVVLLNLCSFVVNSGAVEPSIEDTDNQYVISLVNTIRLDPLAYAESLGYDRNILKNTLPWLVNGLDNGFDPIRESQQLNNYAGYLNALDLAETDAPAQVDPEPDYVLFQEKSGVVSFNNFMSVRTACRVIIENAFKQELDPDHVGQLCLLNSRFNIAGISVESGRIGMLNAYYVTLCLASSSLKFEIQTLNMINQIRLAPFNVLRSMGDNISQLLSQNQGLVESISESISSTGYGPFIDCPDLHDAAKDDSVVSEAFYDLIRSVVTTTHDVESPVHRVNEIFSSMVATELAQWPERNLVFSAGSPYAGLGLKLIPIGNSVVSTCTVMTAEKQTLETGDVDVYGVVYADTDGNGFYSPWEGKISEPIVVFDKQTGRVVQKTLTDKTGRFMIRVTGEKDYGFEISTEGTRVVLNRYCDGNFFLPVKLLVSEATAK